MKKSASIILCCVFFNSCFLLPQGGGGYHPLKIEDLAMSINNQTLFLKVKISTIGRFGKRLGCYNIDGNSIIIKRLQEKENYKQYREGIPVQPSRFIDDSIILNGYLTESIFSIISLENDHYLLGVKYKLQKKDNHSSMKIDIMNNKADYYLGKLEIENDVDYLLWFSGGIGATAQFRINGNEIIVKY